VAEVAARNNYAMMSIDYSSLGGNPFMGMENAIEVKE